MYDNKINVSKCLQLIFLAILFNAIATNKILSRQKRLVWPAGNSRMQLIVGFGIPVDLKRETVIIGLVMKANYALPTNISQWHYPGVYYQRKRRSLTRWDMYKMFQQESQMRDHGGKSCILRAICEAADTPIDKYHGFFNELFHTIFTPTSTTEALSHHTDNEYFAAQKLGQKHTGKCQQFFPECKQTFLEMFTEQYRI